MKSHPFYLPKKFSLKRLRRFAKQISSFLQVFIYINQLVIYLSGYYDNPIIKDLFHRLVN